MTDLHWTPATEIARMIRDDEISESEVAEHFISRVETLNPDINAFTQFEPDEVRAEAKRLEQAHRGGAEIGPLHGVPYAIKDLTTVKGKPTTFGMVPLKDNVADHDAPIVERMKAAGGLYLGKTNTPESGYYGGTDNHLYGPTHNPWKPGHTAGGSSGGSAAAVAAGMVPIAEGSDGAGSVRIPAAMCGVVGLKPTVGVVPQTILGGRYYNWAYHGPISRTVEDAALMLDVLAGPHHADPMTIERVETSYPEAISGNLSGLRAAYSPDWGYFQVDAEVATIVRQAVDELASAGLAVTEAGPGWENLSVPMWHGVWVPGFASEHDMLDWEAHRGQVDDRLIDLMTEAEQTTAVDIGRADLARGQMWDTWTTFMDDYDLMLTPTLASAAFPLEQFAPSWLEGQSLREQLLDWLLTYPYNMLNAPAVTVPAGFTSDGRPVGLQIGARHRRDALVLRAGRVLQERRSWLERHPN